MNIINRERERLSPALLSSRIRRPSAEGKMKEALKSRKRIQKIGRAFVAILNWLVVVFFVVLVCNYPNGTNIYMCVCLWDLVSLAIYVLNAHQRLLYFPTIVTMYNQLLLLYASNVSQPLQMNGGYEQYFPCCSWFGIVKE